MHWHLKILTSLLKHTRRGMIAYSKPCAACCTATPAFVATWSAGSTYQKPHLCAGSHRTRGGSSLVGELNGAISCEDHQIDQNIQFKLKEILIYKVLVKNCRELPSYRKEKKIKVLPEE